MGATLTNRRTLPVNPAIGSANWPLVEGWGVWTHVHLGDHTGDGSIPAPGVYRVVTSLRGQVLIKAPYDTDGDGSLDYIAIVAGLFIDGVLVPGSECFITADASNQAWSIGNPNPIWDVMIDGAGPHDIDIRFKRITLQPSRPLSVDEIWVTSDENGRTWFTIEAI